MEVVGGRDNDLGRRTTKNDGTMTMNEMAGDFDTLCVAYIIHKISQTRQLFNQGIGT